VALVIGTIELGGIIAAQLGAQGSFWSGLENININTLGFIIVGMFVATWVFALAVWRLCRIEERWGAERAPGGGGEPS
jgi:high-affinity nickel-transport protein